MIRQQLGYRYGVAAAVLMAFVSGPVYADTFGQSVVADGVDVYLGVMPSKVLRDDPGHYARHNKQCPVPGGANNYHLMVALFDRDTGARIDDADVYARVSPLGLAGLRKHFGAITVAGAVTYCNYFNLSKTERYTVHVEIRRSGSSKPVKASFTYRP